MIRIALRSVLFFAFAALAGSTVACASSAEETAEEQGSSESAVKRGCLDDMTKAASLDEKMKVAKACADRGFEMEVDAGDAADKGDKHDADWDSWGNDGGSDEATGPSCRTSFQCTNGECSCTAGANEGRSCKGSRTGADSCSTICGSCP